jgi:hypothetical protein
MAAGRGGGAGRGVQVRCEPGARRALWGQNWSAPTMGSPQGGFGQTGIGDSPKISEGPSPTATGASVASLGLSAYSDVLKGQGVQQGDIFKASVSPDATNPGTTPARPPIRSALSERDHPPAQVRRDGCQAGIDERNDVESKENQYYGLIVRDDPQRIVRMEVVPTSRIMRLSESVCARFHSCSIRDRAAFIRAAA